jgi:thiamine transport system substrate-binding protein
MIRPETPLQIDPETVAENRKAWIDEWLAAMSR